MCEERDALVWASALPVTARLHKTYTAPPAGEWDQATKCTICLTVLDDRGKPRVLPIREYVLRQHSGELPAAAVSELSPVDCF